MRKPSVFIQPHRELPQAKTPPKTNQKLWWFLPTLHWELPQTKTPPEANLNLGGTSHLSTENFLRQRFHPRPTRSTAHFRQSPLPPTATRRDVLPRANHPIPSEPFPEIPPVVPHGATARVLPQTYPHPISSAILTERPTKFHLNFHPSPQLLPPTGSMSPGPQFGYSSAFICRLLLRYQFCHAVWS